MLKSYNLRWCDFYSELENFEFDAQHGARRERRACSRLTSDVFDTSRVRKTVVHRISNHWHLAFYKNERDAAICCQERARFNVYDRHEKYNSIPSRLRVFAAWRDFSSRELTWEKARLSKHDRRTCVRRVWHFDCRDDSSTSYEKQNCISTEKNTESTQENVWQLRANLKLVKNAKDCIWGKISAKRGSSLRNRAKITRQWDNYVLETFLCATFARKSG